MKPANLSKKTLKRLFFDFYVLNELWFRTIGAEVYGYPCTKILPYPKEKAIDDTFRNVVKIVKHEVIMALDYSVRWESRHFGSFGVFYRVESLLAKSEGTKAELENYRKQNEFITRYGRTKLQEKPLEIIQKAFDLTWWQPEYGGMKWADAVKWLLALIASKSIKDDIFVLDRIFDLQHNNGFILNKTNFSMLEDDVIILTGGNNSSSFELNLLDFRAQSSPESMLEHTSDYTQHLWIANKNYLNN